MFVNAGSREMEERRKIHHLTTLFKMINDDIDINHDNFHTSENIQTQKGTFKPISATVCQHWCFCKLNLYLYHMSDWNKFWFLSSTNQHATLPTASWHLYDSHRIRFFHQNVTTLPTRTLQFKLQQEYLEEKWYKDSLAWYKQGQGMISMIWNEGSVAQWIEHQTLNTWMTARRGFEPDWCQKFVWASCAPAPEQGTLL